MNQLTDIAALLAEAAGVSKRAAALAAEDRVPEALELERQAERLRAKARRATRLRGTPTDALVNGAAPPESDRNRAVGGMLAERGQSARAVTVAALSEL